jgi:mannose-6-phosphate isomerase-like protein (cupin superfamily)
MQLATNEQLVASTSSTSMQSEAVSKTPEELANIVTLFASSEGWIDRVRLQTGGRWYERLHHGPDHDIWVISWLPGQSTGFHDHGESSGAFAVATGVLEEHRPSEGAFEIRPGESRAFGPDYAHDVRNVSLAPAISIHAYSPPLSEMNEYKLDGSRLVPREPASGNSETLDQKRLVERRKTADRRGTLSIEQVLTAARARLQRLSADEAYKATGK